MHRLTQHSSLANRSNTLGALICTMAARTANQATGISEFCRARHLHPEQVLTDYQQWAQIGRRLANGSAEKNASKSIVDH